MEWQKCGLPHAHILAICDSTTKPGIPKDFDECVCAEIPDEETFPELHKTITKYPHYKQRNDGKYVMKNGVP